MFCCLNTLTLVALWWKWICLLLQLRETNCKEKKKNKLWAPKWTFFLLGIVYLRRRLKKSFLTSDCWKFDGIIVIVNEVEAIAASLLGSLLFFINSSVGCVSFFNFGEFNIVQREIKQKKKKSNFRCPNTNSI